MSINAIHADLMKNLESAVDMGKFLGVFNTLIGVIKDQQNKIDELNAKSERMASQISDYAKRPIAQPQTPSSDNVVSAGPSNEMLQALEEKVNALETKLNDTLLELHGLGEDNSILDREEEPPAFLALPNTNKNEVSFHFTPSSRFVATAAPIHENGDEKESDDESTTGFSTHTSPSVSPGGSKRPSMRSRAGDDNEETAEPEDAEVAAATEQAEGSAQAPAEEPVEEEEKSERVISEPARSDPEESKVPSKQPSAMASPQRSAQASPVLSAHVSKPPSPAPGAELTVDIPVERSRGPSPAAVQPSPSQHAPVRESPVPGPPPAQPVPAYNPQRSKTEIAKDLSGAHPQLHHMPSVGSVTAQARAGLLTVTPMEQRPSTMRESFSTKLQQLESELFPVGRDELNSTPDAAATKANRRASFVAGPEPGSGKTHPYLHRRLQQHYHKYHVDAVLPYERLVALAEYRDIRSHDHKDKMDAKNLKLVTPEKRAKLVRMLKQKGRFIHISRNMLEDSRQKYAARSLKQNVEYVEAETRRLFNKVAQIRDHLKRQHVAIRYLLPMDFHETFDRLVDFLENLETKGGVEEIMALPPANTILAYDQQGNLPKPLLDAIIAKIKPMIAQEVAGVKTQIQTLKDEGLTLAQFAEIMQPETENEGVSRKGSVISKEKELARRRTVDLIKGCIANERKLHEEEEAREREIEEAEQAGKATVSTIINGLSTSPRTDGNKPLRPKTPSMILIQERADTANRAYVDEKVRELEEQLSHLRLTMDASKDTSANDLAFLTAKLDALEVANENMQRHDAEAREQRRKDSEALKVMQKRLAAVSVDNVMDELKVLQLQLNDRPSTSDVSNMMEGISHTFRKHLGENVVGLRGLVDQVYRQIHHKVNREDIKKLISAKLAQMEQDILRREEEMFSAASSTRCMSCGQLPPDPTNAFVNHTAARRAGSAAHAHAHQRDAAAEAAKAQPASHPSAPPSRGTTGAGLLRPVARPSTSPQASDSAEYSPFHPTDPSSSTLLFNPGEDVQTIEPTRHVALPGTMGRGEIMDDEISLHSEHSLNNNGPSLNPLSLHSSQSGTLGPVRSEEIYSVLTGSAGLKSLMPQHTPMIPVRDPYGITTNPGNTTAAPASQSKRRTQVPEPMYRKAKMAAHIKEMVKVSAPSAQNYGFNSTNPFFVMDGYADDADPHLSLDGGSSMHSKGRRPRTQGSAREQQPQVYVPIPRSSMNPNSATNYMLMSASTGGVVSTAENTSVSTVLPQITNKTPRQVV